MLSDYPGEGNSLCIHGYQFDCDECNDRFPPCYNYPCPFIFGHAGFCLVGPCSVSGQVKTAAEEVYKELGPGHSESVYENSLGIEISLSTKLAPRHQVSCLMRYKGYSVGNGYIDILVDNILVVEIKAISRLTPKDEQQVRKYLEAMKLENGLLINFGPDLEIIEVTKGTHEQTPSEAD